MRHVLGLCVVAGCACGAHGQLRFVDATQRVGLGELGAARVCLVDLNADGRPDAVIDRQRVLLNLADADAPLGLRFEEVTEPGLPALARGDLCVFADLSGDGVADAVVTRYLDVHAEGYEPPSDGPGGSCWLVGNGDGTFGEPIGTWQLIEAAPPATTAAIAVGDVDRDGRLDLLLGNWYTQYGASLEGVHDDLLIQTPDGGFVRSPLPEDARAFDEVLDAGGRPTYGAMIADLLGIGEPQLLMLEYGRRWNRLWTRLPVATAGVLPWGALVATGPASGESAWVDAAPAVGLDGDAIRDGRYPDWLKERAKTDARFDRADEQPFRANGNSFDATIADLNRDGRFDVVVAEITHAWAGASSDRTRVLGQRVDDAGAVSFVPAAADALDRAATDPTIHSWNQGDLYVQAADLDNDGREDLVLCSSDYPDNQRLRIFRQQSDGSFEDVTSWVGIDHIGAQQPSLADVDGDGDLDLLVGQAFTRLGKDQIAGRSPRVRLYLNQTMERSLGESLVLRLVGDPARGVNRDALGAVVRMTATIGGQPITQSRVLVGIGGHQGKQQGLEVHFGLGDASVADRVEIVWPGRDVPSDVRTGLAAGHHVVQLPEAPAP